MTLDKETGGVVVARDDAIYTYSLDGRGPPRAYEAPKTLIAMYDNYIALKCLPTGANGRDAESMRRRFGNSSNDDLFNATMFVLLEPDLRVIAHSETMMSPVRFIFDVWGDLYTMSEEGKVGIVGVGC
jgi:hypothetical protein